MAPTRERSPARDDKNSKRLKTTHSSPSAVDAPLVNVDPTSHFTYEVFNHTHIANLHTDYLASTPFKHAVVEKLFQDELLGKVKDECLRLNFTQKDTDIYKVCPFFSFNIRSKTVYPYSFDRSSRQATLFP